MRALCTRAAALNPCRNSHFDQPPGGKLIVWAAFLTALLTCGLALAVLIGQAARIGLIDHPVGRKDHTHPVPVVGGIGILLGLLVGFWVSGVLTMPVTGLLTAGVLLVGIGAIDDLRDIHWAPRILAQVFASLLLVVVGDVVLTRLGLPDAAVDLQLGFVALPFTIFAVVGLINAVNMVDGLDGLAGSLSLCSLLMMLTLASYSGNAQVHQDLLICIGSVCAFLLFNVRFRGRIRALTFLGNGGSALLGLMLAWAAIRLTHEGSSPMTPALAPWLISVPILDCLGLIAKRVHSGRSPFAGDRTHLHHLLLDRGLSVNHVILACIGLQLGLAGTGTALALAGTPDWALIVAFIVVLAAYLQLTLGLASRRKLDNLASEVSAVGTQLR